MWLSLLPCKRPLGVPSGALGVVGSPDRGLHPLWRPAFWLSARRPTARGPSSNRLAAQRCGSRTVRTLREARKLLKTSHFDVVRASEALCDGRGYEPGAIVGGQSGALFVVAVVSESSLWLPVVDKGMQVLGAREFGPSMLLRGMGKSPGAHALEDAREFTAAAMAGIPLRWRNDDPEVSADRGDTP